MDYEQEVRDLKTTIQSLHNKMMEQTQLQKLEIQQLKQRDREQILQLESTIKALREQMEQHGEERA